eukprot:Gregarina_sp_Poly_1__3342@NODE_1963_length_2989_cov_7_699521_g1264_i0_p3_GENE_NODE_1963_length_2989_cov_7_699521_g1264_i0NODE_1963_length_2989_cov_7_699521_g1264_i0_p3_ORF_typecomplete_len104_score3_94_NODE_1963_length_2989_cov_7_699521_g1264_i0430741
MMDKGYDGENEVNYGTGNYDLGRIVHSASRKKWNSRISIINMLMDPNSTLMQLLAQVLCAAVHQGRRCVIFKSMCGAVYNTRVCGEEPWPETLDHRQGLINRC